MVALLELVPRHMPLGAYVPSSSRVPDHPAAPTKLVAIDCIRINGNLLGHIQRLPDYPDPRYYLNRTQVYFYRNARLRHMRLEQVNRYCWNDQRAEGKAAEVLEDTVEDGEEAAIWDKQHRHADDENYVSPLMIPRKAPCSLTIIWRHTSAS